MSSPFPFSYAGQHGQHIRGDIPQSDAMEIEPTEELPLSQRQDVPAQVENKKHQEDVLSASPADSAAFNEQSVQQKPYYSIDPFRKFLLNLACFVPSLNDVESVETNLKKCYLRDSQNAFVVWCSYNHNFYFSFTVSSSDKCLHIPLKIYNTGIGCELPLAGIFFHPVTCPNLFHRYMSWFIENGEKLHDLVKKNEESLKTDSKKDHLIAWINYCKKVTLTSMPPMLPTSRCSDQRLIASMHKKT